MGTAIGPAVTREIVENNAVEVQKCWPAARCEPQDVFPRSCDSQAEAVDDAIPFRAISGVVISEYPLEPSDVVENMAQAPDSDSEEFLDTVEPLEELPRTVGA